jgi:hypothetical protein
VQQPLRLVHVCGVGQAALMSQPKKFGGDEQMFGAKQQIPHGLRSDQEA